MWVEIYNRPDARVMCQKTVPPTLCEHGIKMSTDDGGKYFDVNPVNRLTSQLRLDI
jgi:hypothetical protein